jgi:error-prone DNA polymerase
VVGGFSTYQARGAVGDVGKALGLSEHQVRRFTEHFPWSRARRLAQLLRASPDCRDLPLDEEPYRSALEMAEFLDGFPRYPKMHPCGVVLSRQPMHELTPTFRAHKGWPATHYDMDAVEAIGLVKLDILAQGGLAVMRDALAEIRQASDPPLNTAGRADEGKPEILAPLDGGMPDLAPWDDPAVWEMIAGGQARAVHHIESPAMVGLCRQANLREIDGLVAVVSVIRPGAANEQKKQKFCRRYQGWEPPSYPHPSLEPCLKSTFGLVVYEEHVLQICEAFAGLPPGRADLLRRALGKEKLETIQEIGREFFAAARARGRPEAVIRDVWDLVTGFAGYAFCKAHSTAYAVEAYVAAWLKRYYPVEFMAAVLTHGKGFYDPLVYVLECHRLGIPLLPPAVNQPGPGFNVQRQTSNAEPPARKSESPPPGRIGLKAIRVPVAQIKGLTQATLERLLAARQRGAFTSLRDFFARVGPAPEEMELLIRAGALDEFGLSRTRLFWEAQLLRRAYGGTEGSGGQGWLLPPPGAERLGEAPLEEPTRRQRLEWEAELLGFPVTGHPLELFEDVAWETYCPVARLGEFVGQQVITCGLVIEQRLFHQVTGEPMKFLTLADWTGMVETELFASTYRSYGLATVRYPVLEIAAVVEPFENGRGFTLRVLRAGKPRKRNAC